MMKQDIKMLVMDVDGTLTNGLIYMGKTGEVMKAFSVKDGQGIKLLLKQRITPVVMTARNSVIVAARCRELGIVEVYQGVADKAKKLSEIAERKNIDMNEIAYIGDDINDLDCLKICGFTGCPSDAAKEVIKLANFISIYSGGSGAVREFIEKILEGII